MKLSHLILCGMGLLVGTIGFIRFLCNGGSKNGLILLLVGLAMEWLAFFQ